MSTRAYLVLAPALFLWTFLVFALWSPFQPPVVEALFSWLPDFVRDPWGLERGIAYARSAVIVTVVLYLTINGLVAPIVEELYFRGYLLPGIARYGRLAPVRHVPVRALPPLDAVAAARAVCRPTAARLTVFRRRNIYLAMIVHCGLNTVGALLMVPRILAGGA